MSKFLIAFYCLFLLILWIAHFPLLLTLAKSLKKESIILQQDNLGKLEALVN